MKIIITENQIEKTKKLVNVMFDKGHTIDNIKRYTGLPGDLIITSLKDRKFFKRGLSCSEKSDMLYDYLVHTNLIKKKHTYEDGSNVNISYSSFDGTIHFEYIDKDENELYGYATFLWESSCSFPVDSYEFMGSGDDDIQITEDYYYGDIERFMFFDFLEISTINDLVIWFNQNYFNELKPALTYLTNKYL